MEVHVGGAEANVAVGLSNLGKNTRMVSTLPGNELGQLAKRTLQREGVDTFCVQKASGRMGVYYITPAGPMRQSGVTYDRENSAFANQVDYDFERALADTRHLHVSGISLAVSEAARNATIELARLAKTKDISISFDGNYRPALWQNQRADPRPVIAELIGMADLMFGNHMDVTLLLGRQFSGDGPERRREASIAALAEFPNLQLVASTARRVDDAGNHRIVGRIDTGDNVYQCRERNLTGVVDRIGTGDAFAAGIIDGWLDQPDDLQRALEQGMGLAASKHFVRGDLSIATRRELEVAIAGASDVRR